MKSLSKALWVTLCLGAAALSGSSAALAGAAPEVAPPPSRDERAPAPRDGYVWAPGYWDWSDSDDDYYWEPGSWIEPPSPGVYWTPGYWRYYNGSYLFSDGYWGPDGFFYYSDAPGHAYRRDDFHHFPKTPKRGRKARPHH